MEEKILKLLQSNVFEDNYIGLKLLDNLPKKEIKAFLGKNLEKGGVDYMYSWIIRDKYASEIPEFYKTRYIKGKYYYAMSERDIMVDNSSMYRKVRTAYKKEKRYKIVEVWK